jgi:hypothetical protein
MLDCWFMSLRIVLCCSGKYHIEEERVGYKVSMLLQIRNFGEEDAGVYMCTSTNSLGKIEGSIRLYQIGTVQTQSERMIVMSNWFFTF